MSTPRHLVSVWNPAYAVNAMDAHVQVLARQAEVYRENQGSFPEEEVHVWWGKVRSRNREQALPHVNEILALDSQVERGIPTYLYLTDYSSLYVADLAAITKDNILEQGESAVPDYYRELACDFWFQIWDIRRLVAEDTRGVIHELAKLHNTRYHDNPVSLYGGMVEMPLVVWRDSEVDWFGNRKALTDGRLWAERDAERKSEIGRLSAELRDNLFGEEIWNAMEPATRTFIASAEAVVRARREDPTFNFAGPAVEYAKALETELNSVLQPLLNRGLKDRRHQDRLVRVAGSQIDLGSSFPHQTIGALRRLLLEEPVVKQALTISASPHVTFFTDPYRLPMHLAKVKEVRDPGAHDSAVSRERCLTLRADLLGIGCRSVMTELVHRKPKATAD